MKHCFEFEEIENEKIFKYYKDSKKIFMNESLKKMIKNPIISELGLVKINRENIKIIEKMLKIDSAYSDKENSSKYLIRNLNKDNYKKQINDIIKKIDLENSTHINSDTVGYNQLYHRIIHKYENIDKLRKALESEEYEIIPLLTLNTENNLNDENKKKIGNRNISFATKFCAYMCIELFDDFDKRDRYAKYDRIVAKVIPLYLYYFYNDKNELEKIKEKFKDILYIPTRGKNKGKIINIDLLKGTDKIKTKTKFIKMIKDNYKKYIDLINNYVIDNIGEEIITKNGLDHLLWYYYKGKI